MDRAARLFRIAILFDDGISGRGYRCEQILNTPPTKLLAYSKASQLCCVELRI